MIKLSVLKNRLSGILSVGHPNISVLGITPVPKPIPEEIQLLMYDYTNIYNINLRYSNALKNNFYFLKSFNLLIIVSCRARSQFIFQINKFNLDSASDLFKF